MINMEIPNDFKRAIYVLLLGSLFALFVQVNVSFKTGAIYLAMMALGILIYVIADPMGAKTAAAAGPKAMVNVLYGIDRNWKMDTVYGLVFGTIFIFFLETSTLTMGYPLATLFEHLDFAIKMIVNSILAPIGEEMVLGGIVLYLYLRSSKYLPLAIFLTGVTFAAFHYTTYGAELPAAYVGAFLFRVVASFIIIYTKSLLPTIIMHSMVNTYLYIEEQELLVIGA